LTVTTIIDDVDGPDEESKTKEHTAAIGDCIFLLLAHHSQTYIRRRQTDIMRKKKKEKKKEKKKKSFLLNGSNSRVMLDPSPSIDRFFDNALG
jgi:uncharacterized Fe-S cluster-containing protein